MIVGPYRSPLIWWIEDIRIINLIRKMWTSLICTLQIDFPINEPLFIQRFPNLIIIARTVGMWLVDLYNRE